MKQTLVQCTQCMSASAPVSCFQCSSKRRANCGTRKFSKITRNPRSPAVHDLATTPRAGERRGPLGRTTQSLLRLTQPRYAQTRRVLFHLLVHRVVCRIGSAVECGLGQRDGWCKQSTGGSGPKLWQCAGAVGHAQSTRVHRSIDRPVDLMRYGGHIGRIELSRRSESGCKGRDWRQLDRDRADICPGRQPRPGQCTRRPWGRLN